MFIDYDQINLTELKHCIYALHWIPKEVVVVDGRYTKSRKLTPGRLLSG